MDETALITTLQSTLSSSLSVPVKTKHLEDERPVPVVILDDWDTTEMNFHNSPKSGVAVGDFDNDGTLEYERHLTFDFKTRVEFQVRHSDEVEANKLCDELRHELRMIRRSPQSFHSGLKQCRLGGSGNPQQTFTEPRENEMMASARFYGDHTVTLTPSDVDADQIEQITNTFTFNP